MLTRKDFAAIAAIIRKANRSMKESDSGNAFIMWELQEEIANFCEGQNPRFDSERFNEACEV